MNENDMRNNLSRKTHTSGEVHPATDLWLSKESRPLPSLSTRVPYCRLGTLLAVLFPFLIIAWSIAAATMLWAQEVAEHSAKYRKGLVAHYRFNQATDRILQDRSPYHNDGTILGAEWIKGKHGAALDFDGSDDYIDCGDNKYLRIRHALTLTAWLRTMSRAQQYVISKYGWNIYLGSDGIPRFETRSADNSAWNTLPARRPVSLGNWTFVVAVYNPDTQRMEIYVDGELSNSKPRSDGSLGRVYRSRLILGRYSESSSFYFNGLMGEVRIYNRALSAQEIGRLYQVGAKEIDRTLTPLSFRIGLNPHFFFSKRELLIDLSVTRCTKASAEMNVHLELMRKGNTRPSWQKNIGRITQGKHLEIAIPLDNLPHGQYILHEQLLDSDKETLAIASMPFMLPEKPWWLGTKDGVSDKVLPPWTPMQIERRKDKLIVHCWGRTYSAGGSPFLSGIETAGRFILAHPVRLTAHVDGHPVTWQSSSIQLNKQAEAKVVFVQSTQSEALKLAALTQIEYDGMVRIDWRIEPSRPLRLDELTFEIPLHEQFAKYLYYYPDLAASWSEHRPGALPKDGVAMRFNPVLWLGDEECGLEWFCESARDWFPADESRAIEITRENGRTTLRLHLVSKAIELIPGAKSNGASAERLSLFGKSSHQIEASRGHLSYTFGLQATPLKPVIKDAWDYRSTCLYTPVYGLERKGPDGKSGIERLAEMGVKTLGLMDWTDILCYNMPTEPAKLRNFVKVAHQQGMQVLVYFGFQMSERAPEFKAFLDECSTWMRNEPYSYAEKPDNYPPKPTQQVFRVCYRSVWQDFVTAGVARLIAEYDIDGVYLDGTGMPYPCHNVYHGCGYRKADGTVGPTYPIFEGRRTLRRLYTIVKERKPEGQVNLHQSGFMVAPGLAWATSYWDGEQLWAPRGTFALDRLPLDMFRTEFMGRQWGVPAEFLAYVLPCRYEDEYAFTLLHDIPIRPYQGRQLEIASKLWQLMDRFGRKKAKWVPYWRSGQYAKVMPQNAYVSLYLHPKKGVLAVVSNLNRDRVSITVEFNLIRLGVDEHVNILDAMTDEEIHLTGGRMTFSLPSLGWKLVWLRLGK